MALTEQEAIAHLRGATRPRVRQLRLTYSAITVLATIVTMPVLVYLFDESWGQAAVHAGVWIVMGVAGWWWIASTDSLARAASSVDAMNVAQLIKVDGQRMTISQDGGPDLVWSVESPRIPSLRAGESLWVQIPTRRGHHILAVMESQPEATVLWPADVAWTPGRWD